MGYGSSEITPLQGPALPARNLQAATSQRRQAVHLDASVHFTQGGEVAIIMSCLHILRMQKTDTLLTGRSEGSPRGLLDSDYGPVNTLLQTLL